jgi:hypothetical protein
MHAHIGNGTETYFGKCCQKRSELFFNWKRRSERFVLLELAPRVFQRSDNFSFSLLAKALNNVAL